MGSEAALWSLPPRRALGGDGRFCPYGVTVLSSIRFWMSPVEIPAPAWFLHFSRGGKDMPYICSNVFDDVYCVSHSVSLCSLY